MERREALVLFLVLAGGLLTIFFVGAQTAEAATITVDDSGGADYTKIQDAINASSAGDTVFVYNGTYNEQVTINKSITLTGESTENTAIKGSNVLYSIGIYVNSSCVNINNLTISDFYHGICLDSASNNTITASNIANCTAYGIYLNSYSNDSTVSFNMIADCGSHGVHAQSNLGSNITFNTIVNCSEGIAFCSVSHSIVTSNTITNSTYNGVGIFLGYGSNNNTILFNTFTNNRYGIDLDFTSNNNNTITYNNIYGNKQYGLYIASGSTGNTAQNNWWSNISGPYNAGSNPSGTGDNISDGVPFSPWATAPFNTTSPESLQNLMPPIWITAWSYFDSDGNYSINWMESLYAEGYIVTENGTEIYNGTALSFAVSNKTEGNYTYRVKAWNVNGTSDWSPPVTIRVASSKVITVRASGGKDYTKIQDAINASSAGDTVYVYNGTYNEQVIINKTITLAGESNQSVILRGNGANNGKGIYVTADRVTVSNILVDNFGYGIYLSSSSNNSFNGNIVSNSSGYGIYIVFSSNNSFIGNIIMNSIQTEVWLSSSSNNSFIGNTATYSDEIHSIHLACIYLLSSSNNSLTGNTVANSGMIGIWLDYSSNNSLTGNSIWHSELFLDQNSAQTTTLQNNTVDGKPVYFAKNADSTANPTIIQGSVYGQVILFNCSGFVIRNNTFGATIFLFSSSYNNITGNAVTNSGTNMYAIHFSCIYLFSSSNNTITDNTVANCSEYGILLVSSSNNSIDRNTITNSSGYGLYLECSQNNSITGNTVANCSVLGVWLMSSSNNSITGNTVMNSGDYGIWIYHSSNNTISGNTVANCSGDGIEIYFSSNNSIAGNTVINSGGRGLSLSTLSNDNVVAGNIVAGSGTYGICLYSSSNNNIAGNNIYGNKQCGVYQCSGANNTAYNNWWGSATGPHNNNTNPNGTGDNITDGVPFMPWAASPIGSSQSNETIVIYAPNSTTPGICGWFRLEAEPTNMTFHVNQSASISVRATSMINTVVTIHSLNLLFMHVNGTINSEETATYNSTSHIWVSTHTFVEADAEFMVSINASEASFPNTFHVSNSTLCGITIIPNNQTDINTTTLATANITIYSVTIDKTSYVVNEGVNVTVVLRNTGNATGYVNLLVMIGTDEIINSPIYVNASENRIETRVWSAILGSSLRVVATINGTAGLMESALFNVSAPSQPNNNNQTGNQTTNQTSSQTNKGFLPGFESVAMLSALGACVLIVRGRKRKQSGN